MTLRSAIVPRGTAPFKHDKNYDTRHITILTSGRTNTALVSILFPIKNLALAMDTKHKVLDKVIHVYIEIWMWGNITMLELGHRVE